MVRHDGTTFGSKDERRAKTRTLDKTNAVRGAVRWRPDYRAKVYWLRTHQILEKEEWARSQ